MRWTSLGILLLGLTTQLTAAEPPLVEKYLHSGELARGEQVLESALTAAPQDDQIRLSLGFLQVIRGVERLGQSLYEYGCHSDNNNGVFLRLPVPKNPDPTPVTYLAVRRVLNEFRNDLATAEATLAGIAGDNDDLKLPLRLADINLDLTGDGKPDERLSAILTKLMGPRFRFPADNPEFLVCLDRGDVAWLRAYCHLLMGIVELHSAFDLETQFEVSGTAAFAKAKIRSGEQAEREREDRRTMPILVVKDPARLGRFRKHLLAVCELNHETWRYIRSERDNDHEWLPNSKQTGVIGLPVSDEMVDAWLGMIDEFQGLLNGKKVIGADLVRFVCPETPAGKDFSVKELLENPPDTFDWERIQKQGIAPKYLVEGKQNVDISKIFRVTQVFNNSLSVGYAAWFN